MTAFSADRTGKFAGRRSGMASPAEALQLTIVERLKASDAFSSGVAGRIFRTDPRELPCAWVGTTQSDVDTGAIELIATVHIWKDGEESGVQHLSKAAQIALKEMKNAQGLPIKGWKRDYSEIRLDSERAAYRALVRYRGQTVRV